MTTQNKRTFTLARLVVILILLVTAGGWSNVHAEPFLPGGWVKSASNPLIQPGTSGAWDDQFVYAPSVILDGGTYKMWYAGSSTASSSKKIGYATSPDGLAWTKYGTTPVLYPGTAGSWDANGVNFPSVIKDGSTYKMWYTGMDAAIIGRVGYATSTDGISWTRYASNPVLPVGGAGSWDSTYVGMVSVVKVGSAYKMWYRGGSATGGGIGYATSPDGLVWTKHDPVITGGSGAWDTTPYHPEVVFDGMGYHMWYSGCNSSDTVCQVGYAISSNGAQWTRKGMVLPQGTSGAWDDGSADYASVLLVGSTLKMWYSGFHGSNYKIGYASASVVLLDKKTYLPFVVR